MKRWFRSNTNFLPPVNKTDGSRTTVFVGVSGGVDSSVSAAILQRAGYDVVGVFIKTYYPPEIKCNWREERLDAIRVCEHLGIPFMECDLEQDYKTHVFDYMVSSYRAGITPNPDVFCNKYVKFGGFLDWAMQQGADYVATGHYARHIYNPRYSGEHRLGTGYDTNKDQTYFLYQLQQSQLQKIIFPIGNLRKDKVRKVAQSHGLFTAVKKDSQGLCFVGPVDMRDFLSQYIDDQVGDVVDEQGRVIGSHTGSLFLTIGQRTGFSIFPKHRSPHMKRLFVVGKNTETNTVTVSANQQAHSASRVCITDVSWVGQPLEVGQTVQSRIRHRGEVLDATLVGHNNGRWEFSFTRPHTAVAAGQSLVLYTKQDCLGGGIVI